WLSVSRTRRAARSTKPAASRCATIFPVLPPATASGFTIPKVNVDAKQSPMANCVKHSLLALHLSRFPGPQKLDDIHRPSHDPEPGALEGRELFLRGPRASGDDR